MMNWKSYTRTATEITLMSVLTACLILVVLWLYDAKQAELANDLRLAEPVTFNDGCYNGCYGVASQTEPIPAEFQSYQNPPVFFADARHYGPDIVGAHIKAPVSRSLGPACVQYRPWRVWRYVFWRRHGMEACQ